MKQWQQSQKKQGSTNEKSEFSLFVYLLLSHIELLEHSGLLQSGISPWTFGLGWTRNAIFRLISKSALCSFIQSLPCSGLMQRVPNYAPIPNLAQSHHSAVWLLGLATLWQSKSFEWEGRKLPERHRNQTMVWLSKNFKKKKKYND